MIGNNAEVGKRHAIGNPSLPRPGLTKGESSAYARGRPWSYTVPGLGPSADPLRAGEGKSNLLYEHINS